VDLRDKKVIALGERDGVPGEAIAEVARSAGAQITSWAWNTLAPLAFAIASHSGPKNTREWIAMGCRVFWPARER